MSKIYVPVPRKESVIGSNIRPGFVPGGFTKTFTQGKTRVRITPHASANSHEIREAACRVLERRCIINEPNMNITSGGYSHR